MRLSMSQHQSLALSCRQPCLLGLRALFAGFFWLFVLSSLYVYVSWGHQLVDFRKRALASGFVCLDPSDRSIVPPRTRTQARSGWPLGGGELWRDSHLAAVAKPMCWRAGRRAATSVTLWTPSPGECDCSSKRLACSSPQMVAQGKTVFPKGEGLSIGDSLLAASLSCTSR